jgi:hypothetical protein
VSQQRFRVGEQSPGFDDLTRIQRLVGAGHLFPHRRVYFLNDGIVYDVGIMLPILHIILHFTGQGEPKKPQTNSPNHLYITATELVVDGGYLAL